MGFIYAFKLKNKEEYRYIGKTINIKNRYVAHKNSAERGENLPIYRWIRSKGIDNIEMVILEESDDNTLQDLEKLWIAKIKKRGDRLLNLTEGGEGSLGYMHSEEQKKKWSEQRRGSITGEKNPNYGKFGPAHPAYGRKFSEETKQKLSEQKMGENNPNYGKSIPDETRIKMSLAQKGRPRPKSARSAHVRYHINLNGFSEKCNYCIEEKND
jgi:group I intron endonuclease